MDFISQGRKNMGARGKCPNFEKCMDKTMFVPPSLLGANHKKKVNFYYVTHYKQYCSVIQGVYGNALNSNELLFFLTPSVLRFPQPPTHPTPWFNLKPVTTIRFISTPLFLNRYNNMQHIHCVHYKIGLCDAPRVKSENNDLIGCCHNENKSTRTIWYGYKLVFGWPEIFIAF